MTMPFIKPHANNVPVLSKASETPGAVKPHFATIQCNSMSQMQIVRSLLVVANSVRQTFK